MWGIAASFVIESGNAGVDARCFVGKSAFQMLHWNLKWLELATSRHEYDDEANYTERITPMSEEQAKEAQFTLDMTVGEAMASHPAVRGVFAHFHLGGCSHCAVARYETLGELCASYGIDSDELLGALEAATVEA